jgi:copper chaperone CopZ
MANLDMSFDIVGTLNNDRGEEIKRAVRELDGVNKVQIDFHENKVIVGYTPGLVNVQMIKEVIEEQGVDVSDLGDD